MREFQNEIVLIVGTIAAVALLLLAESLKGLSLWGSLVILVGMSAFYSVALFRTDRHFEPFVYFVVMMAVTISYFALVYKAFGIVDTSTGATKNDSWLDSFYFSVITWTTLGYGDFRPTDALKPFAMTQALLGYLYMGLLVGKVFHLLSRTSRQGD